MSGFSRRVCCCVIGDELTPWIAAFGALLFYYSSSIALTLYNKWLFVKFGLKYPLSVTSVHMTTSFLFAFTVQRFRLGKWGIGVSSGAMKKCICVGVFVGIDIALTNSSFLYVSVPFIEMVKSACPLWVLLLSLTLGIEKFTYSLILIIVTISAGLCLSVYGAAAFNLTGFVMCLTASVMAACRLVASHILLHDAGGDKMDSFQMLAVMAPVSAMVMVIPALMLEVNEIRKSEFASDPTLFKEAGFAVLGGALLAVNLNLSEFIFLGRTSALTMNVAAIFKVLIVSVASTVMFNAEVTPLNATGYGVCMFGVIGYNALKMHRAKEEKGPYAVVAPKSEGDQVPLTQTTELEDGTLGERREVGAHQRVGNAAEDDDDDDEATLLADLED
mmetsp:Transcript_9506/g.22495  ORF Transcript_9506/g.22495 Transcript_9506/m.22495 type:complete len:388 (+) Transcript_9506:463-1626(+)